MADIDLLELTERLKNRCQCFECEDESILQGYVSSFLGVLSHLFCWNDGNCNTILKSTRSEVFELDNVEVCGCNAMYEFTPYWHKGFDPSTLKVFLHKRDGMERSEIELDPSKYNYSFVDNTVLVDVTEQLKLCCMRCPCECSCPAAYKLVVTYEAGYTGETVPSCVLDSLCHFLSVFIAYQNKCGSIDDCANMDRLAVGAVLKQKSVDYVVREWVIDGESMDRLYMRLIYKWSFKTLSMLSLCKSKTADSYFVYRGRRGCESNFFGRNY